MVRKVLSFVVVALGITALLLPWAIQKAGAQEASLQLHRRLEHPSVLIGEEVAVTFELIYTGDGELSYTLIEEVPPEIEPVDTCAGSYNRLAGFIVWTGALHGGQPHEVRYTLRLTEEAASRVPLYAYVSASNGQTSESAAELKRVELPLQIGFERTYIAPGERTTFQLRVENPLERPLHLLLRVEGPEDLGLAELPANLQLAPGAVYDASFPTREMAEGTYLVRLRPLVGRHPVGPEGRATLTVSTVRDERFEASVFDPWQDERTPGFSERVHSVSLPSRYLTPGEQLLLFVRQPDGAHYVSGTGQVSASSTEAVEPYLSEGHLIFPVPSETEFKVRYVLAYEDAGLITPGEREDEEIGLLSLGRQARVLRGTSELLHILDAAELWEPLSGEGVEIVSPRHGQIFSDRQHVDVEIEAPEGARIRLYINGELVAQDRLGQQGSDPNTGRYGEKYIAVSLPAGENRITAEAVLPDGTTLTDGIVVYRSGSPTRLAIQPLTPLLAESVEPFVFEIEATDAFGLPPADGTIITLDVQGGKVLSQDSQPDWQGHQQLLYRGKSYLLVEAPRDPRTLHITARLGDVIAEETFAVTTQADRWFVVGHGSLRAEHSLQPPADGVSVTRAIRFFARGPVDGDAVLTIAYDPAGLNLPAEPSVLWTGTASTEGRFGDAGSESLYVRAERGLSYIQLGADEVDFAGSFSNYTRSHYGLHYFWTDLPQLTVRAFRAYEASRAVEEELAGDGTRYYRLRYEHIEPYSEDVTLVRREWLYPHRIVSEQRVDRDAYRIDYRTGQIFLTEPLAIVDADGYLLSIRVRYQTVGEEEQQLVQGVQSYVTHPLANLRGTFWQVDGPPQSKKNVLVLGVDSELFDTEIDFEIARSVTASNVGRAYLLQLTRRNLADWNVRFSHQNVEPAFQTVQARIDSGMVTTLRGERPFGSGRKLSVSLAREQASPASSATFSAELGSQLAWRSVRPGLLLRGTWGRGIHGSMSVEGSVASEFQAGRVELKSEHALVGSYFTKQAASVEYAILPALSTTLDLTREKTAHEAPARYRMTWGLAHTLTLNGADVQLKGGYELGPSASGTAGAVLYGAATKWHVTDEHTVEAGIEQRRPVNGAGSDALGTTLGWTYRTAQRESRLTVDRQTGAAGTKHALQWQGSLYFADRAGLRGEALWTGDATGGMRTRVSVSAAYRLPSLVLLGTLTGENRLSEGDRRGSLEARTQGLYQVTGQLGLNLGYARRMTDEPTRTEKLALGIAYEPAPRWKLLAEHSYLIQHDTKTSLSGAMVALSRELLENVWLTFGYSYADYVGFEGYGDEFARQRSGLFIEFDVAFFEWPFVEWLAHSKSDE